MRVERDLYAQKWSDVDAECFERDGHYAWMAQRLDDHRLVCEIGTGDGRGTLELLRRGHVVVSIDENPACLQRAQARIEAHGFPTVVLRRETVVAARAGYSIAYAPLVTEPPKSGALLIEGDTRNDPALLAWLAEQKFDGVTFWLMGSHAARIFNLALMRDPPLTPFEYKLTTLAALQPLLDAALRTGGVLSIVERGQLSTDERLHEQACAGLRNAYGELTKGTGLVVDQEIQTRRYDLPGGTRIELTSPGRLSPSEAISRTIPYLISFIERKVT